MEACIILVMYTIFWLVWTLRFGSVHMHIHVCECVTSSYSFSSISISHILNLVNIHLFHDDDNLTALEVCVVYTSLPTTAWCLPLPPVPFCLLHLPKESTGACNSSRTSSIGQPWRASSILWRFQLSSWLFSCYESMCHAHKIYADTHIHVYLHGRVSSIWIVMQTAVNPHCAIVNSNIIYYTAYCFFRTSTTLFQITKWEIIW